MEPQPIALTAVPVVEDDVAAQRRLSRLVSLAIHRVRTPVLRNAINIITA